VNEEGIEMRKNNQIIRIDRKRKNEEKRRANGK
jgi:hypothetical protein